MFGTLAGIFSAIPTFFGGAAFRLLFGEISAFFTAKQDHRFEMERAEQQEKFAAAAHSRNLDAIKLQNDLKVEVIRVQSEADIGLLEGQTFDKAVGNIGQSTGFKFIDAWRSAIQAALATEVMLMIGLHYYKTGWAMDEKAWELSGAVLGLYVADRYLFRRAK
jgi:hypothetical protein